jgi:hypothetical protein
VTAYTYLLVVVVAALHHSSFEASPVRSFRSLNNLKVYDFLGVNVKESKRVGYLFSNARERNKKLEVQVSPDVIVLQEKT